MPLRRRPFYPLNYEEQGAYFSRLIQALRYNPAHMKRLVLACLAASWMACAVAAGVPAVGSPAPEFSLPDQAGRTLRLADGAAECLRELNAKGVLLGIASNSQAYTLRELETALQGAGLNLSTFDRDVRFWSFENGFSKPDPHVFRILTARLEARGFSPAETLMVGDRLDNDIEPARAFGWQTWHLVSKTQAGQAGNWRDLIAWFKS